MPNKVFEAVISFLMALMVVVMTAVTSWLFKLDDRQFDLQANVVTREELRFELNSLEGRIDSRLANIERLIKELVDRERERLKHE